MNEFHYQFTRTEKMGFFFLKLRYKVSRYSSSELQKIIAYIFRQISSISSSNWIHFRRLAVQNRGSLWSD